MLMLRDGKSASRHQRPVLKVEIQAHEEKHQTKETRVGVVPVKSSGSVGGWVAHLPASHSCANVAFAGNKHLKMKF